MKIYILTILMASVPPQGTIVVETETLAYITAAQCIEESEMFKDLLKDKYEQLDVKCAPKMLGK